jgi:transposase
MREKYDLRHMASLTRKVINGRPYYYVRHCQRVDGRPKIVKTTYLGSVDAIVQAVEGAKEPMAPTTAEIANLGDVAALYDQAEKIGLVECIDALVPKRDQGLSVGQYMLLAAINRAACPTSKAQLADWYRRTVLTRLIPASAEQLSSQAFWQHMDKIGEKDIEAIEQEMSRRLVERLQLNLRTLVYDGTNFFSYINTTNPASLPARGHNKQKRGDLRQISLGMMVSTDFHVPLFHKVYAGNTTDATAFQTVSTELAQRYRQLGDRCEHITLIFDKGNNSEEAFATLDDSPFHFIGSLVGSQHLDLLQIPLRLFKPMAGERLAGVQAYRTEREVFGQKRTIVITYNERLLEGQLQGINASLHKARTRLNALQQNLRRRSDGRLTRGRSPTAESVRKQVEEFLSGQHLKSLIKYEIEDRPVPLLNYRTDTTAFSHLMKVQLGKTILFTDNDQWTNEEIILGYRAQHHIESAFRDMKNPHFLGWSPMFHWTDSKIRVHAFSCVLALTLTSLLQRELHTHGIDLSLANMMEQLGAIKEILLVYPKQPGPNPPRTAFCLSSVDDDQGKIYRALDIARYAKNPV